MRKIAEVLRLHHECSSSQRDIALAVGVSPTTVGEYVRRAKSAGIGYPLPAGMDEAALQTKLFPVRSAIKSAPPDPDWAIIHQELARKHVTRELLWQEYKAQHPEGYRYSAFCERYRAWAGKLAVSMRQTHRPGEKLFVDYAGTTLAVVDPSTGEIRQEQHFVAVPGASNLPSSLASSPSARLTSLNATKPSRLKSNASSCSPMRSRCLSAGSLVAVAKASTPIN